LPESLNGKIHSYKIEGIGYDFIPAVLERSIVDEWIKTVDKESFVMARRLIREEGLLVGGSSGSAMVAALRCAKQLKKGQRVVVVFADSVRNYMTKFLSDKWMVENGFMEEDAKTSKSEWWSNRPVSDLKLESPVTVQSDVTCSDCIDLLKSHSFDQVPVVRADGEVIGMVTEGNLMSHITQGRAQGSDPITKVLYRQFRQIEPKTPLSTLSKIFDTDHFALVITTQRVYGSKPDSSAAIKSNFVEKKIVFGLVTRIDLLNFIVHNRPSTPSSGTQSG